MNSLTEENYLKALFHLSGPTGEVNITDLARHLGIKMPTATSMMKRLGSRGLVHYESYKPLKMTGEGQRQARQVVRKHRLTEMFLVERMGFSWDSVHAIAEQVEHIQSAEFFDKMDELLGFPAVDPHGSPIPDRDGQISQPGYQKLSDCTAGQQVVVRAVGDSSDAFLHFLTQQSLTLGTELYVVQVEPFDGSLDIRFLTNRNKTLSHTIANKLLVEVM